MRHQRNWVLVHQRPNSAKRFRADKKAWAHFQTMAPWYRRTAIFRVMEAKREETREKRLQELMSRSRQKLSIKQLQRPGT